MIKRYKDYYVVLAISLIFFMFTFFIMFNLNKVCAFLFLAVMFLVILFFSFITYKRIKEIRKLNEYLTLVNNGDFELNIQDNKEGELSLLKNNIYKVVVMLKSQKELLLKDKRFLAKSLADISHQLKTPITSITVMNDLIKNENDEEKRNEFTSIVDTQLKRMNWLIVTLLKVSKIDANAVEFKKENVNIKDIIELSTKNLLVNADLRNITIDLKNIDDFEVCVDENWFVEAISNIIKNCIEHTNDGGKISVSCVDNLVYSSITIKDNGTGIDKDDLPHIFERFYQGKNNNESSVGIGLALSKSIFDHQSTTVEVESEVGVGTEFLIKIYKSIV